MAPNTDTPKPRKSLDEIAAMMAENTLKMRGQQPAPNEVAEPAAEEDTDEQRTEPETSEAAEEVQTESGAETVEGDGQDLSDTAVSDAHVGEPVSEEFDLEVDDDTMFALDDDLEVPFADLKKAYTADKDIINLVEKQREAAELALVERQKALQDSENIKATATALFQHFEQVIGTPLFDPPPEALKSSNPEAYIRHLDAYTKDQQRIQQQRQGLAQAFQQHTEAEKETRNNLKRQVIPTLEQSIPALKSTDPAIKRQASQDILDAAQYYRFTDEEVNEATDPRFYQMAYDAQQYHKIKNQTKSTEVLGDKPARVKTQTRTLRPRGTTANQRLTAQAKRVKLIKAIAKKTGKVDDVAKFIAAQRGS